MKSLHIFGNPTTLSSHCLSIFQIIVQRKSPAIDSDWKDWLKPRLLNVRSGRLIKTHYFSFLFLKYKILKLPCPHQNVSFENANIIVLVTISVKYVQISTAWQSICMVIGDILYSTNKRSEWKERKTAKSYIVSLFKTQMQMFAITNQWH